MTGSLQGNAIGEDLARNPMYERIVEDAFLAFQENINNFFEL